jgi:hypothetical protein
MSSQQEERAIAHTTGYGCFFKSAGLLLVLCLLCGTGIGGCFFVHRGQYRQQLAAAVNRVRSLGEPLDGAELNAFYKLRDEQNDRTELYLRALAPFSDNSPYMKDAQAMVVVGTGTQVVPSPGDAWAELPQVVEFMQRHATVSQWLHEAGGESGSVRYPVDFRNGFATLLPHAQQVRGASRFLELESSLRMHQGDHATAAESLVCQLRMGESLSEEPILVSQLVRLAVFSAFTEQLRKFLNWGQADEADLARLQAAIAEVDMPRSYQRAVMGERAIAYQTMVSEDLRSLQSLQGGGGGAIEGWLPANQTIADLRPGDAAIALTMLTEMTEAAKQPFPQAAEEAAAVDARLMQFIENDQNRFLWDRHLMPQLMLPAWKKAVSATQERTAVQRSVLATVAIERFRLAHGGKPPEKLSDLVPELLDVVPIDPFDGQPLRLKLLEPGYVTYSGGPDKQDDNGDVGAGAQRGRDIGIKIDR